MENSKLKGGEKIKKDKELFVAMMDAVIKLDDCITQMYDFGFEIEKGVCGGLAHLVDSELDIIGDVFELPKDSGGYTTVTWWWEGRGFGRFNEITIDGITYRPTTPEELWEVITKEKAQ